MQQPKRYQAPTMAEAYDKVRRDLGESAVILSTRKAFAPGLFGQPGRQFVEVVARVPEPVRGAKRPSLEQDAAAHDLVRSVAEQAAAAPAATDTSKARRTRRTTEAPAPAGSARAEAARVDPTVEAPGAAPWTEQLAEMRGMLERLLAERMPAPAASPAAEGGAPAVAAALRDRLADAGLPRALAAELASGIDAADEAAEAEAAERRLLAKMPPAAPLHASRRRAIFLVGPSGAGKTTTAVRLALALEREGARVVIAGTDVNRAGAPQQLMAFGSVTGLDIRLCYVPADLEALLAEDEVDTVIVDTAGHNGARRDRMSELGAFFQTARQRTVLLTLPATMKGADLDEVTAAFTALGVDGLVLTRCDETARYGALAGVSIESAIGVAYTTHSDQVSEAPEAGDHATLARATVRGRWEAPAAPAPAPAPSQTPAQRRQLARVG